MVKAVALVESPAQLVNAAEWASQNAARTRLVTLGPTPARTRFQMHRVAEVLRAHGFDHLWAEARGPLPVRCRDLAHVAALVQAADIVVIGDPYSGIIQSLVAARPRPPHVVVVDDGTATIRYAEQWASGAELRRWHLDVSPRAARVLAPRVTPWLGRRSPHVELFTAMPLTGDHPPLTPLTYAWTRATFGPPELTDGIDLMGTSLVETGIVAPEAYLAGVAALVDRGVRCYLPHRAEEPAKVAAIAAMGVTIVRPELPMEWHARRGPIGAEIWSFPSTVLHTLPLVLADTGVTVRSLTIDEGWFTDVDDDARAFVQRAGER